MTAVLPLAALAAAAALLVWAGASDLARYRIPNRASLGLAAAFALFVLSLPEPALLAQQIDLAAFAARGSLSFVSPVPAVDWLSHGAVGAVALAAGLAAFSLNLAGGGDGKLFAGVALWAGPDKILTVVLLMALIGGVLAAAQLLTLQQARARAAGGGLLAVGLPSRAELRRAPVPYGVAISGAGLYALWGLAAPLT
jgi:prepilin peptidase CpaA